MDDVRYAAIFLEVSLNVERFSSTAIAVGVALVGLVLVASTASTRAAAQQGGAGQATTTSANPLPRTSWDKKPDLTGVWQGANLNPQTYGLAQLERLYRSSAKAEMKALSEKDDPIRHCMPYGYPRSVTTSFPFQIVQAVGVMVVLNYHPHLYRYIPTDGRKHTEDIFPSYQGDSVGHWEGETLVVDVTALNGKVWLAGAQDHPMPTGAGGWITSDALHVVERWRLLDADTLEYQAVVEDPKVLTGPWTTPKISLKRAPIRKIEEGHCIPEGLDWQPPALK